MYLWEHGNGVMRALLCVFPPILNITDYTLSNLASGHLYEQYKSGDDFKYTILNKKHT